MQPKGWKNFWFSILLVSNGAIFCGSRGNAALAANHDTWGGQSKTVSSIPYDRIMLLNRGQGAGEIWSQAPDRHAFARGATRFIGGTSELSQSLFSPAPRPLPLFSDSTLRDVCKINVCKPSEEWQIHTQLPSGQVQQAPPGPAPPNPPPPGSTPSVPPEILQRNDPPQLEVQPKDFPTPSPGTIEQKLPELEIEKLESQEDLRRRLRESKEPPPKFSNGELGIIRVQQIPLPEQLPPQLKKPVAQFRPVGYLFGYLGYFYTSNVFASEVDPIEDGLAFGGLTLASASLPLGSKTYLNGGIDGNLIRYASQSKFNYNQIRFNLGIYQQLTPRMYGEIGWSNQQFFYARDLDLVGYKFGAGDRFLNENSVRLSLGRRDLLSSRLVLDSLYELRLNFSDPESRSRIVNSMSVSLSYYLQKSLQVGIDYQFNLSDFTQREREDQLHRLFGQLTYGLSDYGNLNLQVGMTAGGSTERNIDFNGWFFSVNYNLELGQF
ncbi:MAG: hypothetical protein KME60_25540 [Cyanomargarita calcarea GSE-NOS-MK-12-04C]|jgi:hypothetical protein|uniref:Uncharacterized protein n=1 Tax=Cyanomargarita calcarea GSE-NOS-MK-12-04C TaxID=2839659 RepID=A0A951UVC4_9CYAN|nr:hypothetical protein [Cyanomargarita calcarea GSE-NOS-MK-12-04C]